MLGISAVLFGYMIGLLTWTVQLGTDNSPLQWIVYGLLVFGSAALLRFQVGQARRRGGGREWGTGPNRHLNAADDGSADASQ
ncbi:hypothetical protein SRABI98_00663 [Microbacterium sp. Bi98]|nr:hypothetical protein SRABI98_00663 [Microbacterium sp. Bi98]